MENLLGALGTQLDPAIIGSLVLSWSGRVLAALIFTPTFYIRFYARFHACRPTG